MADPSKSIANNEHSQKVNKAEIHDASDQHQYGKEGANNVKALVCLICVLGQVEGVELLEGAEGLGR